MKFLQNLLRWRVFLGFNLAIFLLKCLFSYLTNFSGNTAEDWAIANNLTNYGIYAEFLNVGATAYKLPIYPLFITIFINIFGENAQAVVTIVQHILYFFIPFLLFDLMRLLRYDRAGVLAGYLFILSPSYFFYSNVIEATNLFIPIFLLWLREFILIYQQKSNGKGYLFGGLTALLFLTQVVAVPFAILLFGYAVYRRRIGVSFLWQWAMVFCFAYSPWVIRNYTAFDKIILTKTPFWQNIYYGFTPDANVWEQTKLIPMDRAEAIEQQRKVTDELTMEHIYKTEVMAYTKGSPKPFIQKAMQNALLLWYVPARYFYDNSPKILIGRKMYLIALNLTTIFALIFLYHQNRKHFYWAIILMLSFTLPYMIGHASNTRFKLDFEWSQLLIIAVFICNKWRILRN